MNCFVFAGREIVYLLTNRQEVTNLVTLKKCQSGHAPPKKNARGGQSPPKKIARGGQSPPKKSPGGDATPLKYFHFLSLMTLPNE